MARETSHGRKSAFGKFAAEVRGIERLLLRSDEISWTEDFTRPARPVDLLLYLGCNILRTAHLASEAVQIFRGLGVDFAAVAGPQFCCGIVHHREGNVAAGEGMARATCTKLRTYGARQIAIWCPTCYLRFEDLVAREVLSPLPIVSAVEYLATHAQQLSPPRPMPARAVLHTHVGTARCEADAAAAMRVLAAVPGLEIIGTLSTHDLGYHCPAGQTSLGPDRFRQIRAELIERARVLGADTIVTLYHSCHRLWSEAATESPSIRNYISVLAEASGIWHRDYYQEFSGLRDPDGIVARARPMWESHGLSEEAAAELATVHFALPAQKR